MLKWICLGLIASLSFAACSKKGKPLPELQLEDLDGVQWTSKDLMGKVVLVNVWASWCGTCIQEIPALNALAQKYEDEEVLFLAFNDEEPQTVSGSLARFPFEFTQFANAKSFTDKVQSRLVKTYPQNLVVDRNGKVVFDVSDGRPDIYTLLDEAIASALAQ